MGDPAEYLAAIEAALVESPIIADFKVVNQWAHADDGYVRVRATLSNGDFLEAAEYFIWQTTEFIPVDYRYHWADVNKQQLRRRWDSTPDHPELPGFPYHCHIGEEENVVSAERISLMQVLRLIEEGLRSKAQ